MACRAMVCVHGVSKRFGPVRALEQADLCVEQGELVALVGPSACGKTSLLRLIAGFEHPDEGEVRLEGSLVAGRSRFSPPERRRVGMVFQDYALFPHLTVAENVGFGVTRGERAARVAELLELVGLADCRRRYPHELSGGQQQRVALARALAPRPAVVLLDEPWSNIDPLLRSSMRDELAAIVRAAGVTVLLVTHDREEAFSLADRVAVMRDGRIVQAGSAEDLYLAPADRWTAEFVGAGNFLPGRVDGELVETLLGRFPLLRQNGASEVEVLIRPEQLKLRADPGGLAEVVAREFRGHDVFYRLQLDDGTTLVSQRPSTEDVPLGARVSVSTEPARVPAFTQ
jgi:iron(III) transport system ATP-binding protein